MKRYISIASFFLLGSPVATINAINNERIYYHNVHELKRDGLDIKSPPERIILSVSTGYIKFFQVCVTLPCFPFIIATNNNSKYIINETISYALIPSSYGFWHLSRDDKRDKNISNLITFKI